MQLSGTKYAQKKMPFNFAAGNLAMLVYQSDSSHIPQFNTNDGSAVVDNDTYPLTVKAAAGVGDVEVVTWADLEYANGEQNGEFAIEDFPERTLSIDTEAGGITGDVTSSEIRNLNKFEIGSGATGLTGDMSNIFAHNPGLVNLQLLGGDMTGDISLAQGGALRNATFSGSTAITGDIGVADLSDGRIIVFRAGQAVTGDVTTIVSPSLNTLFFIGEHNVSGDLSAWSMSTIQFFAASASGSGTNSLTGDLNVFKINNPNWKSMSVTQGSTFTLDIADTNLTGFTRFVVDSTTNNITGDAGVFITNNAGMDQLFLNGGTYTGDLTTLFASQATYKLIRMRGDHGCTGDISALTSPLLTWLAITKEGGSTSTVTANLATLFSNSPAIKDFTIPQATCPTAITIPSNMRTFKVETAMPSADVDRVLIAAAATTWTGTRYLELIGSVRTSASDAAMASLIAAGVTVVVN